MYRDKTVGVVVPCYNEESQIKDVIETMPDYVDSIVIVDDQSKDGTVAVIQEYSLLENSRVVLIEHTQNQGVGGAIASGYKWMRDNNIDMAAVMAGDGQMNPDDLQSLLDPVVEEKCDYSKGNRLVWQNAFQRIPRVRFIGNAILSFLTKIASGYWHVADSQTGYTVINSKALKVIDWDKMYKRYGQPNDLLVKLNVHSFKVLDVPVEPVYNVGEQSGIKVRKVIFSIGWLLVKLFFWRLKEKYVLRDFHPLVLFYLMGITLLGMSVLLFLRLVILWFSQGAFPEITGLTLMFSIFMGMQSLFFAMLFDSQYDK